VLIFASVFPVFPVLHGYMTGTLDTDPFHVWSYPCNSGNKKTCGWRFFESHLISLSMSASACAVADIAISSVDHIRVS
jgi:hypothetical protein